MAEMLRHNTTLKTLCYLTLDSGNEGALAMASALAANHTLEELTYYSLPFHSRFACPFLTTTSQANIVNTNSEQGHARGHRSVRGGSAAEHNDPAPVVPRLQRQGHHGRPRPQRQPCSPLKRATAPQRTHKQHNPNQPTIHRLLLLLQFMRVLACFRLCT